jgi:hypothetical protein
MKTPPDIVHSDAQAIANAAFVECEDVRDFFAKHVRPLLERAATSDRADETVYGAALRVQAWLATLGRLNDPSHFQAALAATRSLFEIAIDCALLHHDPVGHSSAMIVAWEKSALLAAAEKTKAFYARFGRPVAKEHEERIAFVQRESLRIKALRRKTWPNRQKPETHPQRWTGRQLSEDAKRATELGGYEFDAFYALRYSEWCWGTHGSALAGVRPVSAEQFPGIAAFALHESARFALLVARLVLRYFRLWDEIVAVRFEHLDKQISKNRALAWGTQKGYLARPQSKD